MNNDKKGLNRYKKSTDMNLIRSYLTMRRAVGLIGIALPLVLWGGKLIILGLQDFFPQSSLSNYYYTGMRDLLIGSLCTFGVFLWCYQGNKGSKENLMGNLAFFFAIGVAFFPTLPNSVP